MAETAVSSVIDQFVPLIVYEAKLLSGVHKEFGSIKSELESIQCFLKDADTRAETGEHNDGVKVWVKQVRELAYRIEDVIDVYILHLAERPQPHPQPHWRGFISTFFHKITCSIFKLKPRHEIASQIHDIKTTIEEIKSRAERYGFNSLEQGSKDSTWHDPRVASLFIEEDEVVGIESPKDELISRLLAGESKRVVISLVGMAGLGKTTLAKKVYDHQIVTAQFDCRAWITVSQSYKAEDILREMIKQFHKARKDFAPEGIDTMGETSLISELREYLKPKRYVVVFDDVWTIDFWTFIKNALPNNNKGSRVIITTRSGDVGSSCKESSLDVVNKIRPLPEERAWELFCKKAFQSNTGECPPELKKFSLEIVGRCEGLPLAIVAIGGLLSTKKKVVSEWQKFYHSLGSELERNPHLTSMTKIVLLSYHDLPYYLKSCFLYLGLLPEDYSIRFARLIWLWMAEGFIKEQKGKTLEEVGEEYLTELVRRSMVQLSESDTEGITCRVHDLVREIILSKSMELNFCQVLSEENQNFDPQTRRLSIHNSMDNALGITGNSHIRSVFLLRVNQLSESSVGRIVSNFKLMKVLDLEDAPLNYLPEEVGNLFHLRYLSVKNSKIKIIPRSIGKLHNLQTLDIRQCPVSELPVEVNRLHKLRHLVAHYSNDKIDCEKGLKIQKGIGNLQELQTLYDVEANHNDDGVSIMKELENLTQLRGLGIQRLRRESGKALCSSIEKMRQLRNLGVHAVSGEEIMDLQSISSPPQFLRKLSLKGRLEKLSDWIPKLENLVSLSLHWSGLSDDPLKALQGLPSLLKLNLYHGYDGERLHFEAGGFKKLKKLILTDLKELNLLTIDEGALPLLEELSIGPSPQLKEVPSGIRYLTKLTSLELVDMPKDFLERMKVEEGQDYWIVKHIPVVLLWWKDMKSGYRFQYIPKHSQKEI